MGDITHQYGKKFENISYVYDGSSNSLKQGYCLNQVTGYNPSTCETFPLLLDMYSGIEDGFESSNAESIKLIEKVISMIGKVPKRYDMVRPKNGRVYHNPLIWFNTIRPHKSLGNLSPVD